MTLGLDKAWVALVVLVLTTIAQTLGSGSFDDISTEGWVQTIVLILGGAATVAILENGQGPFWSAIRAVVAGALAALTAWQVAFENDKFVTQGEWLGIATAFIIALAAVYQKTERNEVRVGGTENG